MLAFSFQQGKLINGNKSLLVVFLKCKSGQDLLKGLLVSHLTYDVFRLDDTPFPFGEPSLNYETQAWPATAPQVRHGPQFQVNP